MASSSGEYVYSYGGVTYRKALAAPDQSRIQALTKQYEAKATTPYEKNNAKSKAEAKEQQERFLKARAEAEQENAARIMKGDAPNAVVPNGGVASGDPGISQRRTEPLEPLTGMTPDTKDGPNGTVITDQQQLEALPTLADTLNKMVTTHNENGYASVRIIPSGKGSFTNQVADIAFQTAGMGFMQNQMAQVFHSIDRFEHSLAPRNVDFAGYTFITRPRCNLSDANLAGDRKFAAMRTSMFSDSAFYIRCMLDTQFCKDHSAEATACAAIDLKNPFCVLLCNALTAINGFNDPFLAIETTDGGYFQEDQTYAVGGDRMARTYDITCNFRDYPGSPVAATFDYWYQYMMNLGDGSMIQYADAIDKNRLDYTCSIYRFLVDRSRRIVTKWAKCTGCFPANAPTGVPFNKNQGESLITANDNFGITFKVNRIEYNDPIILHEFNMLVRRYTGWSKSQSITAYAYEAQNNFQGIPYLRAGEFGTELIFVRSDASDLPIVSKSKSGSLAGTGLF